MWFDSTGAGSRFINHPPESLNDLTETEKHLLINDNAALRLENDPPTYPPTTADNTRTGTRNEVGSRGGTFIDTQFDQLYASDHISASLT